MTAWIRGLAFFGLPALALVVGLALFGWPGGRRQADVSTTPAPVAPATPEAPVLPAPKTTEPASPAAPEPAVQTDKALTPPSFDIVRVEPTGDIVVAGRAEPQSAVVLLRNGQSWAQAQASAAGQFAMTPKPLAPGTHELSLMMTLPDGRVEASRQTVTVDVPLTADADVVIALVAPDKPTLVLSPPPAPSPAQPTGTPAASNTPATSRPNVAISVVEAEDTGTLFVAGTAHPGASVRLYLNDSYLASAVAGPDGRWSFSIGKGLAAGTYRVRTDDVEKESGKVLSRAEVSFAFNPGKPMADKPAGTPEPSARMSAAGSTTVNVAEIKTTTVTRGDSLWRISQRVYGRGQRYTVIQRANNTQIRNPDLIYPGQVFVLPNENPG
jgi:nucleoid-associated protein YgaU